MGRLKKKIAETDDFLWVLVSRDDGLVFFIQGGGIAWLCTKICDMCRNDVKRILTININFLTKNDKSQKLFVSLPRFKQW